jgi:hypothetical protein
MFLLAGLLKVQAPRVTYFSLVQVKFNRNLFKCSGRHQNHWFRIGTVAQVIRIHLKVVFTAGGTAKWVHPAKHGLLNLWYRINRDSALIGVWARLRLFSNLLLCQLTASPRSGHGRERAGAHVHSALHPTLPVPVKTLASAACPTGLGVGVLGVAPTRESNRRQSGPVNLRLQKEVSCCQAYPVSGNER